MSKNLWYQGPQGWYQAQPAGVWGSYKGQAPRGAKGFTWDQTPMGQAEAERQRLMEEYQRAFDEAKAANEQRYADILQGHRDLYGQTMESMAGLGDAARRDLHGTFDRGHAQSMQGLVGAGMANSTIMPSVTQQGARQRADALGMLNENLRREKIGYSTQLKGNKLAFMERRQDTYPDAGMYAQLMSQYGNAMGNIGHNPSLYQRR